MSKFSIALGLVFSAALSPFVMSQSALAQTGAMPSAKTLEGLYACEAISAPTEQLACFKRETALLRAGETSGDFVTIDKKAVKEIEKESFGFNIPKLRLFAAKPGDKTSEPLKELTLPIKRTSKTSSGKIRFFLENGQVWEQTEKKYAGRLGKGKPDMLTIKNAALGSFRARVNEKGPLIRVRRVQ
jgi:hypothetical protein